MNRHPHTFGFLILIACCVFGFLAAAPADAGSGQSRVHGSHGSHHVGSHGPASYGVRFHAGTHGGLRRYASTSAYRGHSRGYSGYGIFGGYYYRTYRPYRAPVYSYPVTTPRVTYAAVADPYYYATPGSVYDPAFQRGVATQPLDDAYPFYDDSVDTAPQAPQGQDIQPIYIIVQPAPAGSQEPIQDFESAPEPIAPSQPIAIAGGESGQVFLSIHPANASVYLDDELLGSGTTLAEGREPLVLDSGVHVFEVVHPKYQTQRLVFGMPSAGKLQIEFDLEGDHRGRKAHVKPLDP